MVLHGSTKFFTNYGSIKLEDVTEGIDFYLYNPSGNPFTVKAYKKSDTIAFKKYTFTNTSGDSLDIMATDKNMWDSYDFTNGTTLKEGQRLAIQPVYEDNMFINVRDQYYFILGCIISNYYSLLHPKYDESSDKLTIEFKTEPSIYRKYFHIFSKYGFTTNIREKANNTYRYGRLSYILKKEVTQEIIDQYIDDINNYKDLTDLNKADIFYGYYSCRDFSNTNTIRETNRFVVDIIENIYKTSGFWVTNISYRAPLNTQKITSNNPCYILRLFDGADNIPTMGKTFPKQYRLESISDTIYDDNSYDVYISGTGTFDEGILLDGGIIIKVKEDDDTNELTWSFDNIIEEEEQ
jgi:hypothetical protein